MYSCGRPTSLMSLSCSKAWMLGDPTSSPLEASGMSTGRFKGLLWLRLCLAPFLHGHAKYGTHAPVTHEFPQVHRKLPRKFHFDNSHIANDMCIKRPSAGKPSKLLLAVHCMSCAMAPGSACKLAVCFSAASILCSRATHAAWTLLIYPFCNHLP